ncbi:unnamed protein product [Durusdinium trenchii]|uniref:Protochlorophyllide reductase n=1 Tax=Durusdinium trenchii TaxID=1381693 RepID=A0ABP0PYC0_9DINO
MRKSALGISAILGVALLFEPWWRRWRAERRLKELLEEHVGAEGRVVITGADRGIGKELARLLRHSRVSLLLGCLSTSAAEAGSDAKTAISNLELLDFDSVQRFAEEAHEFLREGKPGLRMLVNNAGYKERHEGDRTKYGTGRTWQINFLGPFLLTEFLARRRERDEVQYPASVINVASGHESESNLNKVLLDSLEAGVEATGHDYADSKRALLLWTSVRSQSLALKGELYAHAVSPGKVDTRFGCDEVPDLLWFLSKPVRMCLFRTTAEGALSIAAAGLRQHATSKFGQYFRGEELVEDLVVWRMPEKRLSVQLVRWAARASALEPRSGGRPLDIGGRSLSVSDLLVEQGEEDRWSSAERRWSSVSNLSRQVSEEILILPARISGIRWLAIRLRERLLRWLPF